MIEYQDVNIFEAKIEVLVHACNPKGIWGGLAGQVKKNFPEAYDKDNSLKPEEKKLGTCSVVKLKNGHSNILAVINMYTQPNISNEFRMTNYEAVARGFEWINSYIKNRSLVLGIPYCFASDKGGASWNVIESIIYDIFEGSDLNVIICKLPGFTPNRNASLPFNFPKQHEQR